MTAQPRLREARPDDNEQLIALARRCPIEGHVEIYSDRYPDFFAMLRLQGDRAHTYVVEAEDGQIVACAAFVEKTVLWGGRSVKTLHFGDLRTDPAIRNSRAVIQLIKVYNKILLNGEFHHGIAEFAGGSKTPIKAQKFLEEGIDLQSEGNARMFQLFPIWKYRVAKTWRYRQASRNDIRALSVLLTETHAHIPGAPDFTPDHLLDLLGKDSSFKISDLWVAEVECGAIVACVGLWDQSRVRQVVATRFSKAAKFAVRTMSVAGLLWRLPAVPAVGKPLRYQVFRWPSARPEHKRALSSLLRFLLNKVRADQKTQFILVGFHENDDQIAALKGIFKTEEKLQLFSHRVKVMHKILPPLSLKESAIHYVDLGIT